MKVLRVCEPPSAAYVAIVENDYEVDFPEAYRRFLFANNGAVVRNCCVMVEGQLAEVNRFLPLLEDYATHPDGEDEAGVVLTRFDSLLSDDPDEFCSTIVPIARMVGDDLVCLDYRESTTTPAVVLVRLDRSQDFHPHVIPIAPSFSAFLAML